MIGKFIRLEWVIGKIIALPDKKNYKPHYTVQNPLWNSTMSTHPDQRLLDEELITEAMNDPRGLIRVGDMIELLYTGNDSYSLQTVTKITKTTIETSHQTLTIEQSFSLIPRYKHNVDLTWLPMIREIWTKKDDNTMERQWVYKDGK